MRMYSGFNITFALFIALLLIIGCASDNVDDSHEMGNTDPINESVDDFDDDADSSDDIDPEEDTDIDEQITMVFVGDIMLDRKVKTMVEREADGDYRFSFLKIADYIRMADIAFGNLESIISDKGSINLLKGAPWFRGHPDAIEGLTFAGFDVLSVANNHIYDYNTYYPFYGYDRTAMEDSFERLHDAGIFYIGGGFSEEEAHSPVVFDLDGTSIAYLGYTCIGSKQWRAREDKSGISWLDSDSLIEDIPEAKKQADLVIISMHFGTEYENVQNDEQEELAQLAIDKGAAIVIGHHPHVTQPVEKYKNGYIAFSLGNFVFDQSEKNHEGVTRGVLLEVVVKGTEIIEVIERYIRINGYYQPELE